MKLSSIKWSSSMYGEEMKLIKLWIKSINSENLMNDDEITRILEKNRMSYSFSRNQID